MSEAVQLSSPGTQQSARRIASTPVGTRPSMTYKKKSDNSVTLGKCVPLKIRDSFACSYFETVNDEQAISLLRHIFDPELNLEMLHRIEDTTENNNHSYL